MRGPTAADRAAGIAACKAEAEAVQPGPDLTEPAAELARINRMLDAAGFAAGAAGLADALIAAASCCASCDGSRCDLVRLNLGLPE
jgi:hypothetical protein